MAFIDSYTHKWDSCAGDAIIQSMGGHFGNTKGQKIIYNPDDKNTLNKEGLICSLDGNIFRKSLELIKEVEVGRGFSSRDYKLMDLD